MKKLKYFFFGTIISVFLVIPLLCNCVADFGSESFVLFKENKTGLGCFSMFEFRISNLPYVYEYFFGSIEHLKVYSRVCLGFFCMVIFLLPWIFLFRKNVWLGTFVLLISVGALCQNGIAGWDLFYDIFHFIDPTEISSNIFLLPLSLVVLAGGMTWAGYLHNDGLYNTKY